MWIGWRSRRARATEQGVDEVESKAIIDVPQDARTEAERVCAFRGHTLEAWRPGAGGIYSSCSRCRMPVLIRPDGRVSGRAAELGCPVRCIGCGDS